MEQIYLYFENGFFCKAKNVGCRVDKLVGEAVFNTSMSGYQEIITDPSYKGQFVIFTSPHIGNVGINDVDIESDSVHLLGIVAREISSIDSNYRSNGNIIKYLKDNGVVGITDIDTRALTTMLRESGNMMMICSSTISDRDTLAMMLSQSKHIDEHNYVADVSTKNNYVHAKGCYDLINRDYLYKKNSKSIAVLDYGVKQNILNELYNVGFNVIVYKYTTLAETLISDFESDKIDAIFISNGPGNPSKLSAEISVIKKLIETDIPIFGICLGHQLLSIAHGYDVFRLRFGHHGVNHPVKNIKTGLVEITTQNHNFNVPKEIEEVADVSHINLFDDTIEGVIYKGKKIMSVQHHPESSSGTHDSKYIFKEFFELVCNG